MGIIFKMVYQFTINLTRLRFSGQFKSVTHGQFESAQGSRFDRILSLFNPSN